jgi:hypothetical protein
MSEPRLNIDTVEQGAIQRRFVGFGDNTDPTGWMRRDEQMDFSVNEELISLDEWTLSAEHAGC